MATVYYRTGETVPEKKDYTTFCCNKTMLLDQDTEFPNCPKCRLAAGWRPNT